MKSYSFKFNGNVHIIIYSLLHIKKYSEEKDKGLFLIQITGFYKSKSREFAIKELAKRICQMNIKK